MTHALFHQRVIDVHKFSDLFDMITIIMVVVVVVVSRL